MIGKVAKLSRDLAQHFLVAQERQARFHIALNFLIGMNPLGLMETHCKETSFYRSPSQEIISGKIEYLRTGDFP